MIRNFSITCIALSSMPYASTIPNGSADKLCAPACRAMVLIAPPSFAKAPAQVHPAGSQMDQAGSCTRLCPVDRLDRDGPATPCRPLPLNCRTHPAPRAFQFSACARSVSHAQGAHSRLLPQGFKRKGEKYDRRRYPGHESPKLLGWLLHEGVKPLRNRTPTAPRERPRISPVLVLELCSLPSNLLHLPNLPSLLLPYHPNFNAG